MCAKPTHTKLCRGLGLHVHDVADLSKTHDHGSDGPGRTVVMQLQAWDRMF